MGVDDRPFVGPRGCGALLDVGYHGPLERVIAALTVRRLVPSTSRNTVNVDPHSIVIASCMPAA